MATQPGKVRGLAEYAAAWALLRGLGLLPRRAALATGVRIALLFHRFAGGLRRTGLRNLELAFPEKSSGERASILRGAFVNMGRHLGEFSQFPKYETEADAYRLVRFENRDIVMDALATGRGVLFLTGHFGAWELKPFCLRLSGAPPVNFLVRRIDNPRVEALANAYRSRHGNRAIDKRSAARPVLAALGRGESVGILADLNTLENEGVFVDFFGTPASTTGGLATFALRTDAVVIPVLTFWDETERRYVLRFEPALDLVRTGSRETDVIENTARFTKVLEGWIRERPDHWIWIHKRWKTRPPGESPIY